VLVLSSQIWVESGVAPRDSSMSLRVGQLVSFRWTMTVSTHFANPDNENTTCIYNLDANGYTFTPG
jgi:hypothetical protein